MSMDLIAKIETDGPKSLRDYILKLTYDLGAEKSISPSDAALAFRPEKPDEPKGSEAWRSYLRQVRVEAIGLARKGHIDILRKGQRIDPSQTFKGIYRLRWAGRGVPSVSEKMEALMEERASSPDGPRRFFPRDGEA